MLWYTGKNKDYYMDQIGKFINVIGLMACAFMCSCQSSKQESPNPNSPVLLTIENAKFIKPNIIEVDMVMYNQSDYPVRFYERSNSWGAYQWRFSVKTKKQVSEFCYPLYVPWYANSPTTFSIPPKGKFTKKCIVYLWSSETLYLWPSAIRSSRKRNTWKFKPVGRTQATDIKFPLELTCTFTPRPKAVYAFRYPPNSRNSVFKKPFDIEKFYKPVEFDLDRWKYRIYPFPTVKSNILLVIDE